MSRSRTRRIAKRVGLGLFASMLIAAFASIGSEYGYMGSTWGIGMGSGAFIIEVGSPSPLPIPDGWFWFSSSSSWTFWPTWGRLGQWWSIEIPLWMPCVAIAIPTAWLWWRDRRHPPGHCRNCGYNLTGLPEPRCPECGKAFCDSGREG